MIINSFNVTGIMNNFDDSENNKYTFPTHISAFVDYNLVSETNIIIIIILLIY